MQNMRLQAGFLKFDNIQGSVSSENHKGWISIKSLTFDYSNYGKNSSESRYKPNQTYVSSLAITRNLDDASLQIMAAVGKSTVSGECYIEFVQDSGYQNKILAYKLLNARINEYHVEIDEYGTNLEKFNISFERIIFKYIPNEQEANQKTPYIYDHIV